MDRRRYDGGAYTDVRRAATYGFGGSSMWVCVSGTVDPGFLSGGGEGSLLPGAAAVHRR